MSKIIRNINIIFICSVVWSKWDFGNGMCEYLLFVEDYCKFYKFFFF